MNQEYDKRGNRTRYDKNVQGSAGDYGSQYDLGYTFDASSMLTAISDANSGGLYSCSVTCDANNNIATIDESLLTPGFPPQTNHVYTYFDVDDLNRVTAHRVKAYSIPSAGWMWTKTKQEYDGLGRLVQSTWKNWKDGTTEPAGTAVEHVYDKDGYHIQNYDGVSTYGKVWHWAEEDVLIPTVHPLKSPNADTNNQSAYNVADNATPQRRTFITPNATPPTQGDQRHLWGQGRPMTGNNSALRQGVRGQGAFSELSYGTSATSSDLYLYVDSNVAHLLCKSASGIFDSRKP